LKHKKRERGKRFLQTLRKIFSIYIQSFIHKRFLLMKIVYGHGWRMNWPLFLELHEQQQKPVQYGLIINYRAHQKIRKSRKFVQKWHRYQTLIFHFIHIQLRLKRIHLNGITKINNFILRIRKTLNIYRKLSELELT